MYTIECYSAGFYIISTKTGKLLINKTYKTYKDALNDAESITDYLIP